VGRTAAAALGNPAAWAQGCGAWAQGCGAWAQGCGAWARTEGATRPFAVQAGAPGGIGRRDVVGVVWTCDDRYHAVCRAEALGCADEYSTDDANTVDEVFNKCSGPLDESETDGFHVKLEENSRYTRGV